MDPKTPQEVRKQILESMKGYTPRSQRLLRKLTFKNPNPGERALYFEVGRHLSAGRPDLGVISAIRFEEHKSLQFGQAIHTVFIQRNKEEFAWKEIWPDRVVEFDVE